MESQRHRPDGHDWGLSAASPSGNIYSAFIQDQIVIVPNRLWLRVGSKFEHNIFTGWESHPADTSYGC
jgi:hypothetical protein